MLAEILLVLFYEVLSVLFHGRIGVALAPMKALLKPERTLDQQVRWSTTVFALQRFPPLIEILLERIMVSPPCRGLFLVRTRLLLVATRAPSSALLPDFLDSIHSRSERGAPPLESLNLFKCLILPLLNDLLVVLDHVFR